MNIAVKYIYMRRSRVGHGVCTPLPGQSQAYTVPYIKITGRNPWKITKLQSQHSMLGNQHFQFSLTLMREQFERCRPHKAAHHLTKFDVINDVKLFPIVRVYCRI